jgi:hypothetical protein
MPGCCGNAIGTGWARCPSYIHPLLSHASRATPLQAQRPSLAKDVLPALQQLATEAEQAARASPRPVTATPPLPTVQLGWHSRDMNDGEVPDLFMCPITLEVMSDPAIASDGCVCAGEGEGARRIHSWWKGGSMPQLQGVTREH